MVKIRLTRMGSINKPFYRIVAVDSRNKRDGKYIENIGYYDPKHNPAIVKLKKIWHLNGSQSWRSTFTNCKISFQECRYFAKNA